MSDQKTVFKVRFLESIGRDVFKLDASKVGVHLFDVLSELGFFAEMLLEGKGNDDDAVFVLWPSGVVESDCSSLKRVQLIFASKKVSAVKSPR